MLELTGKCCGGEEAIEFMESLPDIIPEDCKTDDFRDEFEEALNRMRYEIAKGIGAQVRIKKYAKSYLHDERICGNCGAGVTTEDAFCPVCGTRIIWKERHKDSIESEEEHDGE